MKIIWWNFHDFIPNTLREIESSLKQPLFSTFISDKRIQMVYWILKPVGIQNVGV